MKKPTKKLEKVKVVAEGDPGDKSPEDVKYLAEFTQSMYNSMVKPWNEADDRPDGVSVQNLCSSVALACWHMVRGSAPDAMDAGMIMTDVVVKAVAMDGLKDEMRAEIQKTVVDALGVDAENVEVREMREGDDEEGETTWDMLDKVGVTVKKPVLH